jgi:phage baseplate assembly protein W
MAQRVYSFKSSGEDASSQKERASQNVTRPPIGIKTPLELDEGDGGFLKMHSNIENVVADNLKNLILTNNGERLFDYNFGANLKELTFELCSEEIDEEATRRIQRAVSTYMPYVVLNTFEPIKLGGLDDESIAKIAVRITYVVPAINAKENAIEVILYTVG